MITLKDISKTFNKGRPNENSILKNFNLEIRPEEFVVIVGSNGSGKSTLLNILAGSVAQEKGQILFDKTDVSGYKDYQRSKWIARIFQDPSSGTAPDLTILENFRLASLRTSRKGFKNGTGNEFKKIIQERISVLNLGLEDKLDQKMSELSGGQRQSLALLMAISDDTKLLLMDEPTAALDPKTSALVMNLANKVILDFRLTALLVTHQIKDVISYGNRVIQLKEGRIYRDLVKDEQKALNLNDIYKWFND